MKSLAEFNSKIKFVLTDIDDTITTDGHLPSESYSAIWKLKQHHIKVIPVTGRPAGWCDMIARLWPVDGVIGENGGLYYRYFNHRMHRWNFANEQMQKLNRAKLADIAVEIKQKIPNSAISADQFCRVYDLAIDFCEDIPQLSQDEIKSIVEIFHYHGAQAKVSSIHVNGWFGSFNKVTTAKLFLKNEFNLSDEEILNQCAYVGDSPNDEPLFENFKHTFGVANIAQFQNQMKFLPQYISKQKSGSGFCEIADIILKNQ
jgi:HAD superfamily hydrolase (TIGR01484 family)